MAVAGRSAPPLVAGRKDLLKAVAHIDSPVVAAADRIAQPMVGCMVQQQAEGAVVAVVVRMKQPESGDRTRADHTAHRAEVADRMQRAAVAVELAYTLDSGAGNRQLGFLLHCTQVVHRPQHGEEEVGMISDLCKTWIRSCLIRPLLLLLLLRLLVYRQPSCCCCGSCTLSSRPSTPPRSLFLHLSERPSHQT